MYSQGWRQWSQDFAGSNAISWDRCHIQTHKVVSAEHSVGGIAETQAAQNDLFLANSNDWHKLVEWTFAAPLLLTPLIGDVESVMGEVSHKIQLDLCLKIKDIKAVF